MYLVLDQAEEYFLYHADDGGPGSFAEALPAVLAAHRASTFSSPCERTRSPSWTALREGSRASLPTLSASIDSIAQRRGQPCCDLSSATRSSRARRSSVDPALVERVLDEVGAGRIEPALGGLGGVEGGDVGGRIEAPYLQLVMQRLWEEERVSGSAELRVGTIDRLGGAQHIVEEHLEGAMADLTPEQKDVAARIFNHLVTPSGTKIAHEVADLANFGQVSESELVPVLTALSTRRILRSVDEGGAVRYEIFHDVLGEPVLAWRAEHEAERELEEQKQASDRRHRQLLARASSDSARCCSRSWEP